MVEKAFERRERTNKAISEAMESKGSDKKTMVPDTQLFKQMGIKVR